MKRPAVIPAICFIIGILSFEFVRPFLAVLFLFFLLLLRFLYGKRILPIFMCLFFFSLGAFRYGLSVTHGERGIENFVHDPVKKTVISGIVSAVPERNDTVSSRRLRFPLKTIHGTILVTLFDPESKPGIYIGDRLSIQGKLSLPSGRKNPAGFDYKKYLNRQGIQAVFSSSKKDNLVKIGIQKGLIVSFLRFISEIRNESLSVMNKYLSKETAAVIEPLIFGIRPPREETTDEVFVKTGTMHIFAVSGLHIGIVALMIMGLCRILKCPKKAEYFLTIIGICVFAIFAGGRPSSARAAIMGTFVLLGLAFGRKTDLTNALLSSAFLITLFQPWQIFQIGFILSYLAVFSIIYVTPVIDSLFCATPGTKNFFLKTTSVSFGVWIAIAPIISSCFHIITPSIIFANLLAVPLLAAMIGSGFFLLFTGVIGFLQPIAILAALILDMIVRFLMSSMRIISLFPGSYVRTASLSGILIFLFYAVLAFVVIMFYRTRRQRNLIIIFMLFAANIFLWNEIAKKPPDSTSITFFDVGKADACLLEFPDGGTMLVDTGSSGKWSGIDAGRQVLAPYLWQRGIRRVDCVLITHNHDDHAGGLPYIRKNFKIGKIITGVNNFLEKNLPVARGDVIEGISYMDFTVLNPPENAMSYGNLNDNSVMVKAVSKKGNSILFCADITVPAIKDILCFGALLKSDIVKMPHHGTGIEDIFLMEKFLRMTECKTVIITNKNAQSVNKHLLKFLRENNIKVYTTGASGAVVIENFLGII